MQNTLGDLNNHLFAQLERLGDEELTGDKLTAEINRAKAISEMATQVISNGNLALKARIFMHEYGAGDAEEKKMPPMLKAAFLNE